MGKSKSTHYEPKNSKQRRPRQGEYWVNRHRGYPGEERIPSGKDQIKKEGRIWVKREEGRGGN